MSKIPSSGHHPNVWSFSAVLIAFFLSFPVWAKIDIYEFSSAEAEDKYRFLIKELRCPKCQNQDISDSNAPIAQDMRKQVHRLVEEGESTDFIVDFMVERFGEFVSYRPVIDQRTYALWFGPIILLVLGVIFIFFLGRSKKKVARIETEQLSTEEQKKFDQLVKETKNSERDV